MDKQWTSYNKLNFFIKQVFGDEQITADFMEKKRDLLIGKL